MIRPLIAPVAALAALALFAPRPGAAANYRHPYSNVDRRNDAGNDTGDAEVDRLNEGQLNRNYQGPWYYPNPGSTPYPGQGGAAYASPSAGYTAPMQPRAYPPLPPGAAPAGPQGTYAAPYAPPPRF